MRVQQVNQFSYNTNKPLRSRVNSTQAMNEPISFRGYESVLSEIISMDLPNIRVVNNAFYKALRALLNSPNATKGRYFKTLMVDNITGVDSIIEPLRKPLSEMSSGMRDIVIDTKDKYQEPLITIGKDKGLYIRNVGKIGFWNDMFESQNAKNDIRVVLCNGSNQEFVVSKSKKSGQLQVKQTSGNYTTESTYDLFSRSSRKTTDMGATHVPVGP